MADDEAITRDWETYKLLLDLWKQENPIKTTKLQVLLAVNGGLLTVVQFTGGFVSDNWPIFALGAVLSAIWLLSIGRTTLYQQLWKHKLAMFAGKYPDDPRFNATVLKEVEGKPSGFLKAVGGVSSKYYLLGAPIFLSLAWIVVLIFSLCCS